MESFLSLPRYPFKRAMIEHAPDDAGVYALFDGEELIYLGNASDELSIRSSLLLHQDGALGPCTMKATTYTWEIARLPKLRARELLAQFRQARGSNPRCQGRAA